MHIDDYEKREAMLKLVNELLIGEKSGEEEGWIDSETAAKILGIDNDEN